MSVVFERATLADVDTLVAVQIRAFHDDARLYPGVEMGGPPGYNSSEALIGDMAEMDYYKIVVDGRIVGGFSVHHVEGDHGHICRIYLDPDYHNRGLGTQAMQFIEDRYPARRWTLDTPLYATRNHHFYEKLGYHRAGEFLADEGITLIIYEKVI